MTEQHAAWCRIKIHSDAAKKLRDTYCMHQQFDADSGLGKWFASALADGDTDNVLYDSKHSAVRHQKHNENYYTYVRIIPHTMTVCEAEVMLSTARRLYDQGMRMADPDHRHGGMDVIKRLTVEDQRHQMHGRNTGLIMPWEGR